MLAFLCLFSLNQDLSQEPDFVFSYGLIKGRLVFLKKQGHFLEIYNFSEVF